MQVMKVSEPLCNKDLIFEYQAGINSEKKRKDTQSLNKITKEERQKLKYATLLKTDDCLLSVGQRIKKYRIKESYTIRDFAKKVDVLVHTINSLEQGYSYLTLEKAEIFAKILKIDSSLIYLSKPERKKIQYAGLLKKEDAELSKGEIIKKYRILNNYALDVFAEKIGLTYSFLSTVEDDINMISYEKALVFAELLNIDPNLISLTEEEKQKIKFADLLKQDDISLNVGERIKKYRILNNYTVITFSEKVTIARTHLCNIENSKSNATNKLLHLFAAALNIDVSVLSGLKETVITETKKYIKITKEQKTKQLQESHSELLQTDDLLLDCGKIIRKYRVLKGFSSNEFSEKIDISNPYLNLLENNKCNLSINCAKKIAPVLGIDLHLLLCSKESKNTEKKVRPAQISRTSAYIKERQEKIQKLLDAEDNTLTIGDIIKKYRIKKGYSLKELSRKLDITYQYVGNIERNSLNASFNIMKTIADVLDIEVALICLSEEEKEQKQYLELLQMNDDSLSIGNRIKKYRIKNGYSMSDFSSKCKIAHQYLREIERDRNSASLKLTKRMAHILNVDYTLIYISEEEETKRRAIYISKIGKKKIEKYSYLLESEDDILSIGECIRKYRLKNNYTIKEVSEHVGIGLATLNYYELDKHKPKKEVALKIAKLFKIDSSLIYN